MKTSEALLYCRLIPLDKDHGLRPKAVVEGLRYITGKVIISMMKEDAIKRQDHSYFV